MRNNKIIYITFIMLILSLATMAQDTIKNKKMNVSLSKSVEKLERSIDANDEYKTAKNYEDLALVYQKRGELAKAEAFYKKALDGFSKLKKVDDKMRVTRSIAQVQEKQNKTIPAIQNYNNAGRIANDETSQQLNYNDANRLRNQSNPRAQSDYINSNIQILEEKSKDKFVKESNKEDVNEEVAKAYVQKAEVNLSNAEAEEAIESYTTALDYIEDKPEAIKIKNKIAAVYSNENQFDKALEINLKVLEEAKRNNDFETEIKQLQLLADIYFKAKNPDEAITSLKESYALASEKGNSKEVKNSLKLLLEYYKLNGKDKESLLLYDDFLTHFDKIIASDSSLIDDKVFQISEKKILQLEKEKALKDELISKKNTFNYFLIGSLALLFIFLALIVKALYSIKTKNKKIALQSLRREMNPHFIFNSLNSVNQFISENKELEANKYLTSYSNLMRNMMENSNKDFISLSNEIEQLKKYLDLEHLRFQDKFEFQVIVDENLDSETVFIPNMILQPHLENAIWHGLRYKEGKGYLVLKFELKQKDVLITIDDDGIGLTQSKNLKTANQKVHQSRGMTNTLERIKLLNELYKMQVTFKITEKEKPRTGTTVQLVVPLLDKI
ncbi:regulator of cell autolysis [Flavobacterium sp. 316]|uniref:Tetratricopeptide repeat protein n=2 Tax=Flavobacterium TaxID=237 RepID=A0ABY4HQY1_9FLAO|nr:tetratricopeptide repeat protein [Flavobacterium sediminilitoris]KIX21135.1 regulator of cell autolysis [Flavobacterium sp. 316]UOX35095.1 tetratricopeptide repeat protein [Flavobacterium sediminilitoris]